MKNRINVTNVHQLMLKERLYITINNAITAVHTFVMNQTLAKPATVAAIHTQINNNKMIYNNKAIMLLISSDE